jgi:L-ascorbate metabolism protein UlaG (beta-lactamase superfamily)
LNIGGKWKFDFGTVKYVSAIHSSVLPDGTYGGNPGGFVIWNDDICFYFAGDTALSMDMKLIPQICSRLDFAILPIGDDFTMGYEDAVMASDFIECDKIVGCHYDTFGYIIIDHAAAKKAFADKGKELILLPVGGSANL